MNAEKKTVTDRTVFSPRCRRRPIDQKYEQTFPQFFDLQFFMNSNIFGNKNKNKTTKKNTHTIRTCCQYGKSKETDDVASSIHNCSQCVFSCSIRNFCFYRISHIHTHTFTIIIAFFTIVNEFFYISIFRSHFSVLSSYLIAKSIDCVQFNSHFLSDYSVDALFPFFRQKKKTLSINFRVTSLIDRIDVRTNQTIHFIFGINSASLVGERYTPNNYKTMNWHSLCHSLVLPQSHAHSTAQHTLTNTNTNTEL